MQYYIERLKKLCPNNTTSFNICFSEDIYQMCFSCQTIQKLLSLSSNLQILLDIIESFNLIFSDEQKQYIQESLEKYYLIKETFDAR